MKSEKKLFILGVGAQKGGTTWWAFECLKFGVFFPFGKEGHIWTNVEESNTNPEKIALFSRKQKKVQERIISCVKDPEQYFEICDSISKNRNCPIADITPIYCSLKVETLSRIREGLINKGFTVKVLFLARDPVCRAWSMHRMGIKMKLRNQPENQELLWPENAHESFSREYMKSCQQIRTRYELILPNLFSVFKKDEINIFFYENLFCMNTYESICHFLGLTPADPSFDIVRNPSPLIDDLPLNLASIVVNAYSETYKYMRQVYPIVNDLWGDSYLLLK